MKIKFNLINVFIILLLLLLLPLVQNQWLNLYLFDKNNFTIYKFLYYVSGLICPFIVSFTSINKFTFYKFNDNNNSRKIGGKKLLIIIFLTLLVLSTLISSYIFINFKIFYDLIITNNILSIDIGITKYLFYGVITSLLLLFKKTKFFVKQIVSINYFIASILIWYLNINNISFVYPYQKNFLKSQDTNFLNILCLLSIELIYYLWSYISHGTNLSDWYISKPKMVDVIPVFYIIFFYLIIIFYYSIIS